MSYDEQEPLIGGTRQGRAESPALGNLEAADHDVREENDKLTRREWVGEKLESKHFHKAIIFLIAVDATCVLADLVYTFLVDPCAGGGGEEDQPAWLEVLAHISLAITTFFLIEIPLATYAFGFSYYRPLGAVPHASLHLFDAVVILTTFVLEVVLRGREQELVGLLVLLRLWRLVKLVGGIAVGAGEIDEELSKQLAETKQELEEKSGLLVKLQAENDDLRRRVGTSGNDVGFTTSA
ncbi:hypothetical protein SCHPADRAFT_409970 [Schizopora paradoxa]|uniref:Voltage-gated hydrogen channel 1 n=1 Tax=Schizopora paradoxa TaxID=27342 RepID=A0A0H2RT65_9AGAM|nr:hypothetical protein SCHPADRAFT_409970 [Schizopora paradoxa]